MDTLRYQFTLLPPLRLVNVTGLMSYDSPYVELTRLLLDCVCVRTALRSRVGSALGTAVGSGVGAELGLGVYEGCGVGEGEGAVVGSAEGALEG